MNGSKKIKTGKVSMAWSVVMKFIATLSALVILAIGGHTALSLLKEGEGLTVDLGYGSAIHEVEEGARFSLENAEAFYDVDDESAPETHFDAHGANKRVGIFARINWQIKQEKHWYSEMFSTVNTIVAQEVESYRQFEDGHLIATDITKSSLINGADQFCYFIDEKSEDLGLVVWRKPVGGASTWSGLDTEWQTGDPYSSMTIADYKKENGLPAYEMSVYVIRNDTVLSSSEVTLTEDHLYSITYQLNPAIWQDENGDNRGATSYYANQMAFSSGGIVDPQTLEFESIEVTFEFDEAFQVQRVHIEESYAAMYGPIPAPCTAISDTTYSYERDKAHSNAYQDYFEAYEDSKATGGGVKEPTPMDALLSMALGLLEEPTSLKLDLMMGDTPQSGALWIDPSRLDLTDLDLSNLDITALLGQLDLRLQLSDINLWLESCTAYLEYGGIRGALLLNELIGLIEDFTASDEVEAQSEDGADLLSAIINGVFTYGEGQASLLCELPLLGTTVHADFYFLLNEENEASLDRIELSLTANGTPIEGQIAFGEEIPPALEEAQKGAFIELLPYAENLIDLFQSQALHTEIAYMGDAFALEAALEIGLKPFSVGGTLTVTQTKSGSKKSVSFFHLEGDIYVDLDGVKVKVNLAEAAAFLLEYIAIPTESECALDLESLVHVILDPAFAENFAVSEAENELLIVLRGTELLEALGVKFDLGEVSIGASAGRLTASVLGLTAVVTPGTPYGTDDPKQYVEILPYVQGIVDLLGKENLAIQLTYGEDGEDWHVSAHLNFNLKTLALSGTADVSYRGTCKRITIVYGEGVIFLTLDGIKLSADIERAVTLISSFVAGDALPVGEVDAIEQLLSVNFGEFISLGESEKTLTAILKGSALMKAFGIDFELDEVNLCLTKEGTITAEAQGVTVEITEGKAPEAVDPEEYIAIVPYAEAVYELIESGYLAASVSYEAAKLALAGEAVIDLKTLTIRAELCITYGEASKKLELVYAEEAVYVSVEGMRIKASVAKLAGFIARFVEIPETDVEANELLESVLQLDISMLVTITEADDTLSLALAGNELLKLFGIDFELGEVNLCLTKEGTITAEAQGVKISVTKGSAFSFDPTGYRDITPVLEKLPALLEAKALSLEGGFTLIVGGTQIDLVITSGVLSWRNGIYLYLDALLKINDVVIPMQICVETQDLESTTVKFAYGNIGAEIAVDEIGAIGDAFMNVYNRVSGILSKILSGENVLPEAETLTELLSALLGGSALADAAQSLDWIELLQNLTFAESTHGLIAFAYEGFTIDILDRLEGLVTLNFHYASELFALRGDFNTGIYVSETLPSMPLETDDQGVPCAITYLTAEDFADVVDYIGALTGLLAEQSINLHAEGEVASTDTETFANGIKYKVVADVHYQTGGGTVFTIDTKKRSFVVDPELYLNLSLQFVSENAEVDSIYLDFFVLDANFDGSEADGILDFFVTVSNFPEGDANRNELSLHAPADEIMTILSGALTMLGGEEIALLNDYMISKWIPDDLTTVAQLRALGGELFKLIGIDLNLSELLGSLLGTAPTQGGSTAQTAGTGNLGVESAWKNWHEWEPTYYIKSISKGENGFAIVLNGKALYEGAETSEDVHILFNKEEGERGSRITLLSLDNVWNGAFTERTSLSLTLDYGAVTKAEQITAGYSAQGIEELIFALARSATHGSDDAQPVYAFNNNFYINGTISASLLGIVNLDINVEISVTIEQGEPVINVHLEYQGYAQWLLLTTIVAINGDSTLDLTIQNGMAYMKRVQTTEFTVGLLGATEKEITPIVLYRAMPLDNFMDDILDQLSFILNFGPFIADQIANAEGDSTSGGGSGIYDLGDVLTGFSYTASENSNAWNVSIDGESFSNGILGDLAAKLTAENGLLRGINITKATINIPVTDSFSLSLSLSANLRWKNAGGTMESGSDITENVSEVIEAPDTGMVGLIEKLNAEGWGEETPYLQAKPYTVNYWLETAGGSEKFSSQTVLVSTDEQDASGYAQNAIYSSNLRHPEPGALDNAKYSHAWKDEPPVSLGEVLSSDYSIRQTINTFTVLFFSESDLDQEGEENWMENGNGYFVREMTMEYDAKISFYAMGDLLGEIYTVTGSAEILLPAVPPYPEDASLIGRWAAKISEREAVFTAQYPLDIAVYYVSEIAFTLNGNTAISYTAYDETLTSGGYTLITPYAEGYTFLGWYECVNGIWQEASTEELVDHTFEALWMENLKIEKATAKRTSSGWLIKTYTYKMSIEVSGGSLCGAFANGSGVKISCKYSYTLSSGSSLGSKTFSSIQGDTNQYSNSRSSSSIDMKIELSYSYEEIFATKVEVTGKVTVST